MSNTVSKTLLGGEENLASSMGSGSLRVLATPAVVALMENAAASLAFETFSKNPTRGIFRIRFHKSLSNNRISLNLILPQKRFSHLIFWALSSTI